MFSLIAALGILFCGGLAALACGRTRAVCVLGPLGVVAGAIAALAGALPVLAGGAAQEISLRWSVPLGSFALAIDPLAAWFVAPIAVVCALAAVYGGAYWGEELAEEDDAVGNSPSSPAPVPGHSVMPAGAGRRRRNLGPAWFWYQILAASMLLVVLARNGVLFLMAWELMALASFFLVMFEAEREDVRQAGWIYLVATHLGTAFLLAMFTLLGSGAGTLDFARFHVAPGMAGAVFVLAVIGFGAKAGFLPLHVWLPEAHPAAPSHVSAVMSGVMLKTGIYGLLRVLSLLGPPAPWWGWTLLLLGLAAALWGVLAALAQHDLKRLLAYSSVENVGIIAVGLGLGLSGVAAGMPLVAALGFGGALLHVPCHALLKSLLFLAAGSVLHATGTRQIDRLGGLLRRMPVTGLGFCVGAVGICGLPPLCGFVSEWLVYLAAFAGLIEPAAAADPSRMLRSLLVLGTLALVGGLAATCFAKALGVVFLGEPRSPEADHAHEVPAAMRWPMLALAAGAGGIALAAPALPRLLAPVLETFAPRGLGTQLARATGPLCGVCVGLLVVAVLGLLLAQVRRNLLAGRKVESSGTWDCGYAAPTPRMQYTGSSLVRPLTLLFRSVLRTREEIRPPTGFFPGRAALHTETPDLFQESAYRPLFAGIGRLVARLRWLQQGRIQLYVLYIALTLLALLIWKLG